jgi:phosphonate transport system permease protein
VLAALFAFPFSFLAARRTSPHPLIALVVKATFNFLRTIPELVLAIIFVASVGFGILPGILAMGLHSVGSLGKLYSEAIEKAEPGLMEAVASCGGSRFQVIVFGVIPQVVAQAADFTLYRWEMNFRASTVVGMVGAGGIGFELLATLRLMQYRQVAAILLAIFVVVQLVDSFGNQVRTRLMGQMTT